AGLVLQRERVSPLAGFQGLRLDPGEAAQPLLRSQDRRGSLSSLHRRVADRRGSRPRDHGERAPSDGDQPEPVGGGRHGGPRARHAQGASLDPRQPDREPSRAGARGRGDGDGRCLLAGPARVIDRFWEAYDRNVKAWTSHDGPFSWEGKYFHHRQVNIWPRPFQEPHPPIWITALSPSSARAVGEKGYIVACFLTGFEGTK